MAQREILLPWDSQPQEPVEVDWSNPLTQGLVFLAPLFGGQVHDIAGGKRATVTGTLGHGATVDGVFGLLSGTQYYDYADFGAELTNTTPATIAWMQTPIAGSAYSSIGTLRPSGSTGGFNIAYQHATVSSYRFATGPVGAVAPVYWDASGDLGGMTNGRSDRFVLRTSSNLYTTTRSDWTLFRGQDSWTGSSASNFGSVGGTNRIGRNGASDAPWDGTIGMLAVWNRALSDEEARGYNANPWQLFVPRSIWVPVSAGGGGVSGTLATTNANDTSAASGTTTVTGTVARTNANDTSAASGTTTIVGTLATTNADDTSAASGSVGGDVTGTVNYTNANDTVSASGTTTVTGTVARTNADDSAAASGWAGAVTGTLAYTNANDTADASGIAETGFLAGIGGWGPIRRRKRRDEDEDKPQEVPEVVEVVAAKPRKTLKLADIIGKRQAAQITSVDLSEAVAASKKRKRQQDDELLLLM